jgi:hypothetical protein
MNVNNLGAAEFLFGRHLRRVDGRSGFRHIHHFARLLLVREGYIDVDHRSDLDITLRNRVETCLLHAQFVGSRGEIAEFAVPHKIGFTAHGKSWRRRVQLYARQPYGHSVFIGYRNQQLLPGLSAFRGGMARSGALRQSRW